MVKTKPAAAKQTVNQSPIYGNAPISSLEGQMFSSGGGSKSSRTRSEIRARRIVLYCCIVAVLVACGLCAFFFWLKPSGAPGDTSAVVDSTDDLTLEATWGVNESDNSEEAYIAHLRSLASSADAETAFTAKLDLANYLIMATDNTSEAEAILLSIDATNFDNYHFFCYYNVLYNLYSKTNNTEKRDEYNTLAVRYRNLYVSE